MSIYIVTEYSPLSTSKVEPTPATAFVLGARKLVTYPWWKISIRGNLDITKSEALPRALRGARGPNYEYLRLAPADLCLLSFSSPQLASIHLPYPSRGWLQDLSLPSHRDMDGSLDSTEASMELEVQSLMAIIQEDEAKVQALKQLLRLSVSLPVEKKDIRKVIAREIPQLVLQLHGPNARVKEYAAAVLSSVVIEPQCRDAIARAGGIPPLVSLMWNGTVKAKEYAANIIEQLSFSIGFAEEELDNVLLDDGTLMDSSFLIAAGVIPPFIDLLSHGSEEAKFHVACAFYYICERSTDEEDFVSILAAGAIPALVNLLSTDGNAWSETALKAADTAAFTLMHLTDNKDIRVAIAAAGAIPLLMEFLRSGLLSATVLKLLSCLSEN